MAAVVPGRGTPGFELFPSRIDQGGTPCFGGGGGFWAKIARQRGGFGLSPTQHVPGFANSRPAAGSRKTSTSLSKVGFDSQVRAARSARRAPNRFGGAEVVGGSDIRAAVKNKPGRTVGFTQRGHFRVLNRGRGNGRTWRTARSRKSFHNPLGSGLDATADRFPGTGGHSRRHWPSQTKTGNGAAHRSRHPTTPAMGDPKPPPNSPGRTGGGLVGGLSICSGRGDAYREIITAGRGGGAGGPPGFRSGGERDRRVDPAFCNDSQEPTAQKKRGRSAWGGRGTRRGNTPALGRTLKQAVAICRRMRARKKKTRCFPKLGCYWGRLFWGGGARRALDVGPPELSRSGEGPFFAGLGQEGRGSAGIFRTAPRFVCRITR